MQTLSVKEAARRKRCTLKYVYDLLAAGRLPGARKHDGKWCIPADSLGPAPECVRPTQLGFQDETGRDQS